jgi:hypothetical protein
MARKAKAVHDALAAPHANFIVPFSPKSVIVSDVV